MRLHKTSGISGSLHSLSQNKLIVMNILPLDNALTSGKDKTEKYYIYHLSLCLL